MAREVGPDVSITPDSVCDCDKSGYVSWPLSAGGMSPLCVYVKERERERERVEGSCLVCKEWHTRRVPFPPLSLSLLFFLSSSSFYTFTFFFCLLPPLLTLYTHITRKSVARSARLACRCIAA